MLSQRQLIPLTLAATLLATPAVAVDAGRFASEDFAVVKEVIENAAHEVGPENVLVVFDIDNTMMATDIDLGSEHWFMWQSDLIKQGIGPEGGAVASTVADLLRVQTWIYAVTGMHPTDATLPETMHAFSERGVRTMALTSRGPEMRDATLREIARAGIDLGRTAPGPQGGYAGPFFVDGGAKPVLFENGVMLTQGQHKGVMLAGILAKTGAAPRAIVFMDDRPHHLDGVQDSFKDRAERVYTVQYDHERAQKAKFAASDKAEARAQWCLLSHGLAAILESSESATPPFYSCAQ